MMKKRSHPTEKDSNLTTKGPSPRKKPSKIKMLPFDKSNPAHQDSNMNTLNYSYTNDLDMFWDTSLYPIHRPLPATTAILAIVPQREESVTDRRSSDTMTEEERTGSKMPLLTPFMNAIASLRVDNAVGNSCNDKNFEIKETEGNTSSSMHSELDVHSTILTKGHHIQMKGILKILDKNRIYTSANDTSKFNLGFAREREFKKLLELFKEERRLYNIALMAFRENNLQKFLIGFKDDMPTSVFAYANAHNAQAYKSLWNMSKFQPFTKYGKCLQAISLENITQKYYQKHTGHKSHDPFLLNYMDILSPKIVFQNDKLNHQLPIVRISDIAVSIQKNQLEELQIRTRNDVKMNLKSNATMLCDDDMALSLATQHDVDVVISNKAIQSLLKRAGPHSSTTQWMLPISFESLLRNENNENDSTTKRKFITTLDGKNIMLIEDPIPHSTNPRECLTLGITDALYHHFESISDTNNELNSNIKQPESNIVQYVYTLLSLPKSTNLSNKTSLSPIHRILVRSENYIVDEHNNPLDFICKLEYFPERGVEEPTTYERTQWFIEKILQPNKRIFVCSVDPTTCKILKIEEKSIAHALAMEQSYQNQFDTLVGQIVLDRQENLRNDTVSTRVQIMMDIISNFKLTLDSKWSRCVVCSPGRDVLSSSNSAVASVHKQMVNEHDMTKVVVDVEVELHEAEGVILRKNNLMECFRLWQWNDDDNDDTRLPYTFPVKDGFLSTERDS